MTEHIYQNRGNYSVNLTVTDNHGINASTIMNISVDPSKNHNIVIQDISGGFGLNVTVKNTGTGPGSEIPYTITCTPGLLGLLLSENMTSDVIDELTVDESQTIRALDFRGIGPLNIMVQVDETVASASGFLLGPLLLRVREQ